MNFSFSQNSGQAKLFGSIYFLYKKNAQSENSRSRLAARSENLIKMGHYFYQIIHINFIASRARTLFILKSHFFQKYLPFWLYYLVKPTHNTNKKKPTQWLHFKCTLYFHISFILIFWMFRCERRADSIMHTFICSEFVKPFARFILWTDNVYNIRTSGG